MAYRTYSPGGEAGTQRRKRSGARRRKPMTGRARRNAMKQRVRSRRGPTGKPFDSMGIRPGGGFMTMMQRMMGGQQQNPMQQNPMNYGAGGQPHQYPNMDATPEQQAAAQGRHQYPNMLATPEQQAAAQGGATAPQGPGTSGGGLTVGDQIGNAAYNPGPEAQGRGGYRPTMDARPDDYQKRRQQAQGAIGNSTWRDSGAMRLGL